MCRLEAYTINNNRIDFAYRGDVVACTTVSQLDRHDYCSIDTNKGIKKKKSRLACRIVYGSIMLITPLFGLTTTPTQ
jgi:hypothetical protein